MNYRHKHLADGDHEDFYVDKIRTIIWGTIPLARKPYVAKHGESRIKEILDKLPLKNCQTEILVVTGMPAVGKTEFVTQILSRVDYKVFRFVGIILADSIENIKDAYRKIAIKQKIATNNDSDETIKCELLKWFSKLESWILFFDNVSDPNIIKTYFPQRNGMVFVTTQFDGSVDFDVCKLNPLDIEESKLLFQKKCARYFDDIEILLKDLEGLPLAINIAASILYNSRKSVGDLHDELINAPKGFISYQVPGEKLISNLWHSAWLCIEQECIARKIVNISRVFMTACCHLNANNIPINGLRYYVNDLMDGVDYDQILELLNKYSLINYINEKRTSFKMHRLLQVVLQFEFKTLREESSLLK